MPNYLTPGVYIEEIERGPRPIEGVPTSIAAFIGETDRGPTEPTLVTSYRDYQRHFGGIFATERYLPYAVNGFFTNGGQQLFIARVVGKGATAAFKVFGDFTLTAVGPGDSGNKVWAAIQQSTTQVPDPKTKKPVPVGFMLKMAYWPVMPADGPFDPFLPANNALVPRPQYQEIFDDLSPDPASSNFYVKRLDNSAMLATLTRTKGVDAAGASLPTFTSGKLDKGSDAKAGVAVADFEGDQVSPPQGLAALELDSYRQVALVHAPYPAAPSGSADVARALIDHCERLKSRFAILDPDPHQANYSLLDPRTNIQDTQYAAYYYPWLWILDPVSDAQKLVPPGGYVTGIYARTDTERGVWKAPANETVREAIDVEFDINDPAQGVLNPLGVDVIRKFPGRGILVWGARTLSANGLWKYVPVRRLFIFLERSIYEGTQWVVFEPNDQKLWARVTDSIRLFLRTQWREGALFGATEDQAFFITCDRTTMTQDDILNGRLICEIGIAPVRPAEFVIFRIFQNTADAQH